MVRTRINTEALAAAGITGGFAVAVILFVLVLVLIISFGIYALAGLAVAYCWNVFLVPNVEAQLPTLVWWQAAIGLLGLRMLAGLILPSRS